MSRVERYYPYLIGLLTFIIYLFTIAPSVVEIDSGELAAVQATLGIAHPTGYPLFTIIGYLFLQLPLPFSEIYQATLLAALFCSGGVVFIVYSVKLILENLNLTTTESKKESKRTSKKKSKQPKNSEKPLDKWIIIFVSSMSGVIAAFSETFWAQSTSIEVYSLHIFLISGIIYFLLKAYYNRDPKPEISNNSYWWMFAIFLAFGFSNHMTTLLILPGVAYLYFAKYKFNKESFVRIGNMLLLFIPVLVLIYLYLPFRASTDPVLNWGNPVNFENFWRHFTGKQYQVWIFSSMDAAKQQLGYFFRTLPGEFAVAGLLLAISGIFTAYKKARSMFVFFLINFIATVIYSINYDITDIDSYFLLAYISLAFFSAFGIIWFVSTLKINKNITASIAALLVIIQLGFNYSKVNRSNEYIFEDYTKACLSSIEENSMILSYQWDFLISEAYYFQCAENFRSNIAVIDKELIRRSWYFNQINIKYPSLLNGMESEVKQFKEALQPFERGGNYNSQLLERLFRTILTKLVTENINDRHIYVAPELVDKEMKSGQFSLPDAYTLVPLLFFYKVVPKNSGYIPAPEPDFQIRFGKKDNYYFNSIKNIVGRMLSTRALYELHFEKTNKAREYIEKIKESLPGFRLPGKLRKLSK